MLVDMLRLKLAHKPDLSPGFHGSATLPVASIYTLIYKHSTISLNVRRLHNSNDCYLNELLKRK